MSKRKEGGTTEPGDRLEIIPLGAGNEVGRSCVFLSYKGKNILFDCGIHPAYSGNSALPFFDVIDPSTIDVLLVTHFHLDHSASLPYFLEQTSFKGRVFMTHATKIVYKLLVSDYVRISKGADEEMLFSEKDLEKSMDRIEVIDFHQITEVNGIRFWCYTAGHVLGAAMFMVDIAGIRILYTGDYSREEDRHLQAAEMPPFSPEICIIESTYGIQHHQPREDRERIFTSVVSQTVLRGGRVLIPAFALGRAQELLLILDDFWSRNKELHGIPIFYASPLAKRCMDVYQTYINSMNDSIKAQYEHDNPFEFKHIEFLANAKEFEDSGPCVVMASPGGLQSGLSRQLFDRWCQDRRNSCVIPGYVVEGTLAKEVLKEPNEITLMSGQKVPLRMRVHYISFSAHADYPQTHSFLKSLNPLHVVLVHGEATEMARLKEKLTEEFSELGWPVYTPKNSHSIEMFFKRDKVGKAIGKLADKTPSVGDSIGGILVRKGFQYQLMDPNELIFYTQLSTVSLLQRQFLHYIGSFAMLKRKVSQMYDDVSDGKEEGILTLQVYDFVRVLKQSEKILVLEWNSDPMSDMVADSIVAIVLQLGGSNGGEVVEIEDFEEELEDSLVKKHLVKTKELLENMFGGVEFNKKLRRFELMVDEFEVEVDAIEGEVICLDDEIRERVEVAVNRLKLAMFPLNLEKIPQKFQLQHLLV